VDENLVIGKLAFKSKSKMKINLILKLHTSLYVTTMNCHIIENCQILK